jgi:hypothetical protein
MFLRRTRHVVSIVTLIAASAYASQEPATKQQKNEPEAAAATSAPKQQPTTPTKVAVDGSVNVINQPDAKAEQRYADERADAKFNQWIDIATLFFVGVAAYAAIAAWRANKRSADAEEAQVGLLTNQLNAARSDATEQRQIALDGLAETRKSADAASRSADVAEQALITAQRPWLLSHKFIVRHWLSDQPYHSRTKEDLDLHPDPRRIGFIIHIQWKNFGTTPALEMRGLAGAKKLPLGNSRAFELPEPTNWPTAGIVAPNNTAMTMSVGLTYDEINKIALGELDVFIYGRMRYRDGFPDTPIRHTDVCARVEVIQNPRTSDHPFAFPGHHEHNRAD